MSGAVRISNDSPFVNDRNELAVSAGAATAYFPNDATIAIDSDIFYQAMVEAIAENVAQKVADTLDLPDDLFPMLPAAFQQRRDGGFVCNASPRQSA